jgi:integrase/recombinase XerD
VLFRSQEQLQEFFNYLSPKYCAIFAICLFSGCRISEALSLKAGDIGNGVIVFRKSVTKGKLKTREVDINPQLQGYLDAADLPSTGYIFPSSRDANKPMSSQAADEMLRKYCDYLGFEGISTHSFRRTALTMMSASGIPLRTIQEISGHDSLATLQRYLEVTSNQKKEAIAAIGF